MRKIVTGLYQYDAQMLSTLFRLECDAENGELPVVYRKEGFNWGAWNKRRAGVFSKLHTPVLLHRLFAIAFSGTVSIK